MLTYRTKLIHYSDIIISAMASQISGVSIVYWQGSHLSERRYANRIDSIEEY